MVWQRLPYCVSRNDPLGRYRCDVNGRRKCLFGWYGSYCLTYCVPSNDSLGHYICGANGQKSCLDYWYGTNCLIYCKPRNDSTGHFICNSTGHSICLPGWQGEQCTEKEISKATFITASTTVTGSTKGFQHQNTSSEVTSFLGSSSLRTNALSFRSTFAVVSFTSKDRVAQSTEVRKIAFVSSQVLDLASQTKQMSSSFEYLSQSISPNSKRAVSTATSGGILKTTEKQPILQPAETIRPMIRSVFHTFCTLSSLRPQMDMSSCQVSSSQPTPSRQQTPELKFTTTPSTVAESNYSYGNLNLSKQTETTKRTMTSALNSTLRQGVSQTADYLSLTASVVIATPLVGTIHTKRKALTSQAIGKTRAVKSHSAIASVLKEHSLAADVPTSVKRNPNKSPCTRELQTRETTRVPISPPPPSVQLASSTGSLCPDIDETTTKPEAIPVSSTILVEFCEKQERELVSNVKEITLLFFISRAFQARN